jgi:hypothetical protein
MKKFLLGLLAVVFILGVLSAVGFAGYRYGLNQAEFSAADRDTPQTAPGFGPHRMPMHNFGNDEFQRGFGSPGFPMMRHGRGFGFFAPLMFLVRLAFWGFVIWAVYMLVLRSGWRLTRTVPAAPVVEPAPSDSNVENKESDLP